MKGLEDKILDLYKTEQIPGCAELFGNIEILESSKEHLVITMKEWDHMLNPMGYVQGGFIVAAFDNAFGMVGVIAAERIGISINLQTYFHRSLLPSDKLTIKVRVKSMGKTIMHVTGEGYNDDGQLIASAHSDIKLK